MSMDETRVNQSNYSISQFSSSSILCLSLSVSPPTPTGLLDHQIVTSVERGAASVNTTVPTSGEATSAPVLLVTELERMVSPVMVRHFR